MNIALTISQLRLFLLLILVLFVTTAFGDNNDEADVKDLPFKERLFVGGYLGLQFGTHTFIDVSPIAGYRLTNSLSAGIGLTYQYYYDRYVGLGSHTFGGNTFARILIIPQVFVQAQYEILNIDPSYFDHANEDRIWEENYLLGGGYRQQIGEKAFLNIMALYNFNHESSVYYQNPIFRFSIEIGL